MKIGIITFHWATNYGAVLQSFVLQYILMNMGYAVEIINYKPKLFDYTLRNFFFLRQFLHISSYRTNRVREKKMVLFRSSYLRCSKRYYTINQLQNEPLDYDVLISGSDQVMNPSFLLYGEKNGSTAYFLDFGKKDAIRLTYAVSFGTVKYPESLLLITSQLLSRFNALSVREMMGVNIFSEMGRSDAIVVPDPTLLLPSNDYDKIFKLKESKNEYILVYMLRSRLSKIESRLPNEIIKTISTESVEEWMEAIKNSKHVLTNSFHGMVFSIIYHVPFTVVLREVKNEGMNDRFFTLLEFLGLTERIMTEDNYDVTNANFDWGAIDLRLDELRNRGLQFIENSINRDR